jgi:hypothetical protein
MARLLAAVCLLPALTVAAPAPKGPAGPPAVVELFEDDTDTFVPLLKLGGEAKDGGGKVAAEKADTFTGGAAVRVSGLQRFNHDVRGWAFPVTAKPTPGEYRYLRFAWKKAAPGPIMFQLCTAGRNREWVARYHAGRTDPPWPAVVLRDIPPADWQVVTRDLVKDFGEMSVGGIGLSPLQGGDGLFDHILLGRTVEDLDRATAAAVLKRPARALTEGDVRQHWLDMGSPYPEVAETAVWGLVAGRADAVRHLAGLVPLTDRKGRPVEAAQAAPLIAKLTHERQAVRDAAAGDLLKLGDGVLPHLRAAIAAADGEDRVRLQAVMDRRDAQASPDEFRLRRVRTALSAIGTPEATDLREKVAKILP